MAKIVTKIGDMFSVECDAQNKKYFQYVANDLSMLNSDGIRVFKTSYSAVEQPDPKKIVADAVEFHAHVVIKWGVEMGLWHKVGHCGDIGRQDVFFRDSGDYGNPEILVSHNWWVWKVNEEHVHVGALVGDHQKAEIGIVVSPLDVVHRIRTGKYDFVYPSYE